MKNTVKKRNPVTQDLHTDKYHMRVVAPKKVYNRSRNKRATRKEYFESDYS